MAVFGLGNFENDDALDFVGALVHGGGPELVLETLKAVADAPAQGTVDVVRAAKALAAAEMVAAGRGRACDDLPTDAGAWLGTHTMAAAALREYALRALARVREASALRDLWDGYDPKDAAGWRATLADLEKRLS